MLRFNQKFFFPVLLFSLFYFSLEAVLAESIYDFKVNNIDGDPVTLADYKGKALLIVNVASRCGFTDQYEGLQALYEKYKDRGFVVLGFPCNQFGGQEPGSSAEIKFFCKSNYDVSFPMFEKIDVNGDQAHPLYVHLKQQQKGVLGTEAIKWNFTKFLVDQEGRVLKRYASATKPKSIASDIENLFEK